MRKSQVTRWRDRIAPKKIFTSNFTRDLYMMYDVMWRSKRVRCRLGNGIKIAWSVTYECNGNFLFASYIYLNIEFNWKLLKFTKFIQGALNKGWRNEAISAFHDRWRSIFYRFCALKYWYFPSQMERSWYFPSQIERSVAARAALEVTKWNAVHSKVGVAYVRLNKNKSDCNDRGKFSNQNCSILWRKPRLIFLPGLGHILSWSPRIWMIIVFIEIFP